MKILLYGDKDFTDGLNRYIATSVNSLLYLEIVRFD